MIKIRMVQGQVFLYDVKNKKRNRALNEMKLLETPNFHYELISGEDSRAIVEINDNTTNLIHLGPESILKISKNRQKKSTYRLFFGKMWCSITDFIGTDPSTSKEVGNAVIGVRG